jgi:chromosome segregation ATPase
VAEIPTMPVMIPTDEATALLNLISAKLDLLLIRQAMSQQTEASMSAEVDHIKASVQQLTDVNHSAITLLGDLSARVRALQSDPAALTALADEIDQRKTELVQAVLANTPAAGTMTGRRTSHHTSRRPTASSSG